MRRRRTALYIPRRASAPVPGLAARTDQETSEQGYGVGLPYQRHTFWAAGRAWLVFAASIEGGEGSGVGLLLTSSGESWDAPELLIELPGTPNGVSYTSCHLDDGGDLHLVVGGDGEIDMLYRRGTPQPDGTIDWRAGWQTVEHGVDFRECTIATDSNGSVWIGHEHYNGGAPLPKVTRSDETDGTWVTASGFPAALVDDTTFSWVGIIRAGTGGEMMAVWLDNALFTLGACLWDGTWGEAGFIDGAAVGHPAAWSLASDPATGRVFAAAEHQVFVWDGEGWTGESFVPLSGGFPTEFPLAVALAFDPLAGELHAVYVADGINQIRHVVRSPTGEWSAPSTLVDADADHDERPIIPASLQISEAPQDGLLVVAFQLAVSGEDELWVYPLEVGGASAPELKPARIESTAQVFAPHLHATAAIAPSRVESTVSIPAPSLAPGQASVEPGFVPGGSQVFSPTLAPGPATVEPAHVPSGAQVFGPELHATAALHLARIESTAAVFTPTLAPGVAVVEPAMIGPGSQVFRPSLLGGEPRVPSGRVEAPTVPTAPVVPSRGR